MDNENGPAVSPQFPQNNPAPIQPKKSKKLLVWAAFVILVVVAGIGWFFWNKSTPVLNKNLKNDVPTDQISPKTPIEGTSNTFRMEEGIYFTKSSDWNMVKSSLTQSELVQSSGESKGDKITIQYIETAKITDQDAKFGDVSFWYDNQLGKWVRNGRTNELTGTKEPTVVEATPAFYVENNIPVFKGTGRWLTYIVPLTHKTFLKLNITGSGATQPLTDLVKTFNLGL